MAINFETNIAPLKERELYPDEGAQKYLLYWFSIQDHSVPKFIPRDQWEEKRAQHETFVVQNDALLVLMPDDVKLWEIFTLIREIDQYTYPDALKAKAEREKLRAVITTFRDAGIYLKTYVEQIDWTDDTKAGLMAKELATDFYRYSRWLQFRKQREVSYEHVPKLQLSTEQDRAVIEERFREVEKLLMGTTFVAKRYDRLEKNVGRGASPQEIDQERAKVVKLFFKGLVRDYHAQLDFDKEEKEPRPANQDLSWKRYVEQYLGKQDADLSEEHKVEKKRLENDFTHSKPWNKFGPTFAFQQATALGLERFYDKPKQEFEAAILRRGKEKLKTLNAVKTEDFLSKMGIDFSSEKKRLIDVLGVDKLKARLRKLKESGASITVITQEELSIVGKIQQEISKYEYEEMTSLPTDIVGNERINCVGASLLSSVLFDEIGISYLQVSIEEHSVVVVITSDNKVHYRDMRYAYLNRELSDAEVGEGN
jgi:hypothetical protein